MRTVIVILAMAVAEVAEALRGRESSEKVVGFYVAAFRVCVFMDIAEFIFMFIK